MFNDGADVTKHMARLERLKEKHGNGNGAGLSLAMAAKMAGWNTPQATDGTKGGPNQSGGSLPADAAATDSTDGTRLNAAHSRWLMGFPSTWDELSPSFDHWRKVQERIALGD